MSEENQSIEEPQGVQEPQVVEEPQASEIDTLKTEIRRLEDEIIKLTAERDTAHKLFNTTGVASAPRPRTVEDILKDVK